MGALLTRPELPDGFELDEPSRPPGHQAPALRPITPAPPPGFVLERTPPAPSTQLPEGFQLDRAGDQPSARTALGEIGTGLKRGALVNLPEMAGGALKYISQPGQPLYETGQRLVEGAEQRATRPDLTLRPGEHGAVTNALAGGAEMLAPSVAPALAVGGALAAAPVEIPAAAALGITAVAGALPAALSQGQETYENVLEAGGSEEEAQRAGRINALIEGGGEAVANLAGAKFVTGLGRAGMSALEAATSPAVVKPFVKGLAKTAAAEVGTEVAQSAGEAAVEQAHGVEGADPVEAAKQAVGPTLGLTALLAPFGLAGHTARAKWVERRANTLSDADAPVDVRNKAAFQIAQELRRVDEGAAANFLTRATQAINTGSPLAIDETLIRPATPVDPAAAEGRSDSTVDLAGMHDVSPSGASVAADGVTAPPSAADAPSAAGRSITVPAADQGSPSGHRYAEILDSAVRRFAMEEEGQATLDEMQDANISPQAVSEEFWSRTYPLLNGPTRARFEKYLKNITGWTPGSLTGINVKTGEQSIAESWLDVAGAMQKDLPIEARHLEGIERGYLALMHWANSRRVEAERGGTEVPRAAIESSPTMTSARVAEPSATASPPTMTPGRTPQLGATDASRVLELLYGNERPKEPIRVKELREIAQRAGLLREGVTRADWQPQLRDLAVAAVTARRGEAVTPTEVSSGSLNMPGANYTGIVSMGTAEPENLGTQPSAPNREQIITRESVLKPFLQALGVPLFQGGVKGKKRLGWYRPKAETVRIKKHSDLEVAAHELAHLIDDRLFNGFRTDKTRPNTRPWARGPRSQVYANELKSVSYDQGKVYEGWAEFVRLWMTQPQEAATKAPEFTKWMDAWAQSSENPYGAAILKAREDMLRWFAQSGRDRLLSKIGPQERLNDILTGMREEFRQSIVDNLQGILSMELDLAGEQTPLGPYETARLTKGSYAVVDGAVRWGAPVVKDDGTIKFKGKGLEQILKPVSDRLDDWIAFAVAKSASELKEQGRENLFTAAEIRAGLELSDPTFERVFAEYQTWNRAIVDFAETKGVIDPLQRARWRRQMYLPFYRVNQPTKTQRRAGIEGNVSVTHALTGGTGNLRDILGNVVQNASNLITEAMRNEARLRIVDFAKKLRGGGKWITPLPKESRPVTVDKDQIRAAIYKMLGINKRMVDAGMVPEQVMDLVIAMERAFAQQPAYMQFWQYGQAPKVKGGDQVIAVLRNGKPEYYEVSDPILFRSIQALRPKQKHVIQRVLNAGRRLMQGSITLSLDFMAANIWRDTLHAWAFSGHRFKPVLDSLRGMKSRLTSDATYRDFIANGGGMASYLLDEGALRRHLEKWYTKKGINYRNVIDTPAKLLYALETIAESFEVSSRLGEFRRALAGGESPRRAAYAAREITTDFAMRGDAEFAQWFYDSVPFLKAAVNSVDRAYRGFTKDPHRGAIWAKTGTIAVISALLYLWNRDDELYQELEDWDKDSHWHVILRPEGREPIHLRFPKIWEIGAMASAAERTMEAFADATTKGQAAAAGYGKHLWRILKEQMSFDFVPGLLEPLYEVYALNRNRFTGREIENMGMRQRLPFARYSEYTSRSMAGLGELTKDLPPALQISPAKAEALIRGYFNTYGMYGLALLDRTLYGDQLPEAKADQIPGLRRFVRSHPARTQAETDFWTLYDELKQLHNTALFMEKWRPDVAVELDQKAAARQYQAVHEMGEALKDYSKQITDVYRSSDYTPAEKRQVIDSLQREKNHLLREFMGQTAQH